MPMVFGFATHRRQQLEAEFLRIAGAMRQLGAERFWLAGDLARDNVGPESELELLVVHETEQPFHRRSDFFQTHLRPQVGTSFIVYTPDEFLELRERDPLIVEVTSTSDEVIV
ncbi:MAG: hypothetical protein OXH13_01885 [Chloroflexi bacterium]|nr:hypothetical protein [Chloroflexota bacterium]MCY3697386.1 hypothetical protein [Chloroflexota bacterium]MXX31920.1 hypothetical protein [Chloroflexota bacterium]MYB22816.1 hypothetical protein [Chloroflexota bacterium]MYD15681.1 hypothetical protein [Chloroflexota bacterium]